MFDIEKMADDLFLSVGGYVTALTTDLEKRVHDFDARLNAIPAGLNGKDGDPGRDGLDGKDADPVLLNTLVVQEVSAAMAAIPKPRDGKDADPALIHSAVAQQFEALAAAFVQGLADERF